MSKYNKYVFDTDERKFVGDFESMYQDEANKKFDSWHQEDMRQLNRLICLNILAAYDFKSILDFGCGKGTFSHLLKKVNNSVVGFDVSKTAVEVAQSRYPDLDFQCMDMTSDKSLEDFFKHNDRVELSVCMDTLSYLPNYHQVIQCLSKNSKYFLTALYLPEDPIGYVKSPDILTEAFSSEFEIIEHVLLKNRNFIILFGRSRHYNS